MFKKLLSGLILTAGLLLGTPVEATNPSDVPHISTITALKALGLASSQYPAVLVDGYSSSGDGGGGYFLWSASSCNNAGAGDSMLQFPPNSGGGCWLRQWKSQAGGFPIEWAGGIGGDTTYNSGHATTNVTAFETAKAALPNLSGTIVYKNCPYSVTGVIVGNHNGQLVLEGCGNNAYYPTWIGSGLAYVYASSLSGGDACKTTKFIVQNGFANGINPGQTVFRNFTIVPNSTTGVTGAGWCWHNGSDYWNYIFENSTVQGGDYGAVWEFLNGNTFTNVTFQSLNTSGTAGVGYGLFVYVAGGANGVIQKVVCNTCAVVGPGTGVNNSWALYEDSSLAGSYPFGADDTIGIDWIGGEFVNAKNGINLAGSDFFTHELVEGIGAGVYYAETGNAAGRAHSFHISPDAGRTTYLFSSAMGAGTRVFSYGFEAIDAHSNVVNFTTPFTVSTLPTAASYGRSSWAWVTDATTCATYGGALTGGGSVTCPVHQLGGAWVQGR